MITLIMLLQMQNTSINKIYLLKKNKWIESEEEELVQNRMSDSEYRSLAQW